MKITNVKQLEDVSKTSESFNKRDTWIFEGLKIEEKESDELSDLIGQYDPIDIQFINCQFTDNCFDGIFCGPRGPESISVLNSNLTELQFKVLINSAACEMLKSLNLSDNCLGENEVDFFETLKNLSCFLPSLSTLIITNNGISKKAETHFKKHIKKTTWNDLKIIN